MARSPLLSPPAASGAGLWSLDGERLHRVETFAAGPAVVLVPGEAVLLTVADLPLASARGRAEAAPFAVEDLLAEPLAAVHVAVGDAVAAQRYLVGVVRRELMDGWAARLAEAGLARAAIVPDPLALPVAAGGWSVDLAAGRALVRTGDGAGFALPAALLEQAWRAAGAPPCVAYGEPLPPAMGAGAAALDPGGLAARLVRPALDLRQGAYARPRRALPPLTRRIALVAGIGVAAHGAIAAADTLALTHLAAARAHATRLAAQAAMPDFATSDATLAADLAERLAPAGPRPSGFLPLLARVSAALKPALGAASLRDLAYDGAAATMTIEVDAADIAGVQRIGDALRRAGLAVESGAATVQAGRAGGSFVVHGVRA